MQVRGLFGATQPAALQPMPPYLQKATHLDLTDDCRCQPCSRDAHLPQAMMLCTMCTLLLCSKHRKSSKHSGWLHEPTTPRWFTHADCNESGTARHLTCTPPHCIDVQNEWADTQQQEMTHMSNSTCTKGLPKKGLGQVGATTQKSCVQGAGH